jgi:glutamate dehydrogenase
MSKQNPSSADPLLVAIQNETKKFHEYYLWLEKAMPPAFFEEVHKENVMLIAHNLMGFHLQEYFSTIHLKRAAIVLCLDSADADLRILKNYAMYGIKNYEAYVSNSPPPIQGITANLRIATLYFTEAIDVLETSLSKESKQQLMTLAKERNSALTEQELQKLISGISNRFLRSLSIDTLILALDMFFRAKTRDNCQYEIRYNENWKQDGTASMQIVLAWRNTPKHNFLYRLTRTIHRHGLTMQHVNATYIDPYSKHSILVMVLDLHGSNGQAAWDVADISDFLREFATVKYFASFDVMDDQLVSKGIISGNMGNFLRASVNFIHQALVNLDVNLYTIDNIEQDLCRHPELTFQLTEAIKYKFDPKHHDYNRYLSIREKFLRDVYKLDTGQVDIDTRRKNVLLQGMNFIHHTLKTNFYRTNFTALCFRLDPKYLDAIPFDRTQKFPELPFGIFYMKGMHFFGFHIRFKDLSRGGLRTVFPEQPEVAIAERNNIFNECYNLAYTQHMKNKDIPEGGAKGIIFLKPYDRLESESIILEKELQVSRVDAREIEAKIDSFRKEQTVEYLYHTQRAFIESLITLVNCDPDGTIRAKHIVDYWKRPEYLYLGPDEYMHDAMIQWIADFSKKYHYKPGSSFISSKPRLGINHKQYGVTSLGLNVYMEAVLKHIGIDPTKEVFTVKMSGGPDGDVAGNQIYNLYRFYPNTAKLLALTDATGTIYEAQGLDLTILAELFKQGKGIKFYPPEKLTEGGFLVDRHSIRRTDPFVQQTLCWKKIGGKLVEDWLSGSDTNHLLRHNVHQIRTDIFIPSGGRPRTLNESNVKEFLDETGKPTSRAIVEGANLYLTPHARHFLENLGVLIIKDSSANKTGVICSSFEVLSGLTLGDEKFMENKPALVQEILERLRQCAANEAHLLLRTHKETHEHLTTISDRISTRINQFTYQLLDYLDEIQLSNDPSDPMLKTFLSYCLPTLRNKYQAELMREIPEHHKKAIMACHIGAQLVYKKGLKWFPSVVDILPILLENKEIET